MRWWQLVRSGAWRMRWWSSVGLIIGLAKIALDAIFYNAHKPSIAKVRGVVDLDAKGKIARGAIFHKAMEGDPQARTVIYCLSVDLLSMYSR